MSETHGFDEASNRYHSCRCKKYHLAGGQKKKNKKRALQIFPKLSGLCASKRSGWTVQCKFR